MSKRLEELYALRDTVDKAIAREQGQMLRMAQLRDAAHAVLSKQTQATADTIRCVAAAYDLNAGELLTRERKTSLVAARQVLCAVLRSQGLSYPEVGLIVGRHHTSVMHACRVVDASPQLTARVSVICESLSTTTTEQALAAVS